MDDENIKSIFDSYQPELSADTMFMSKLKRNIDVIESVKEHAAALRRRTKIAVAIAALSGFITGMFFTLLFPYIGNFVREINIQMPSYGIEVFTMLEWILLGAVVVFTSYNVYEITFSKLSAKENYAKSMF